MGMIADQHRSLLTAMANELEMLFGRSVDARGEVSADEDFLDEALSKQMLSLPSVVLSFPSIAYEFEPVEDVAAAVMSFSAFVFLNPLERMEDLLADMDNVHSAIIRAVQFHAMAFSQFNVHPSDLGKVLSARMVSNSDRAAVVFTIQTRTVAVASAHN